MSVDNMRKDYLWNTVGTSANAFVSLLLLIAVTRINGIEAGGLWGFCFSFAILFFTIGLYGGRIYQVSDISGEFESRNYVFLKFITSGAMLVTAIVFILVNSYDQDRIALLLSLVVYKMLDAIADPLYGVMQRKGHLYLAGISMTLKAAIGFGAFIAVNIMTLNVLYASLCLLAANAVFILVFDIPYTRKLESIGHVLDKNLKPSLVLLKASAYIFAFSLLTNLLINIPRYFVDVYHTTEELGWFAIIIMPATMLNLFVQFVIQPKLVPLSERFAAEKYARFNLTVTKLILVSLGFGAITIYLVWLVGVPVLSFIYAEDLTPWRTAMTLVVFAGTLNTMTMIYSMILSVMRKFKIQLFNYLVAVAGIFIASAMLVEQRSVDGAVLAFVIANAIQAALFFVSYYVIFRKVRR
ncbi:MAG: oligosaccharide flippase family protein [Clostridiales bacterium]|nr:oligosaccharide flippase family protein [Clostridiales bacterium]